MVGMKEKNDSLHYEYENVVIYIVAKFRAKVMRACQENVI